MCFSQRQLTSRNHTYIFFRKWRTPLPQMEDPSSANGGPLFRTWRTPLSKSKDQRPSHRSAGPGCSELLTYGSCCLTEAPLRATGRAPTGHRSGHGSKPTFSRPASSMVHLGGAWGDEFICGSKPMVSHFGIGEFSTHFGTYFSGWIG